MNACNPLTFDGATCLGSIFDAAVSFLASGFYGLPMWAVVAVIVVALGVAWRWGGLPGLAAAAFGFGFLLGRKPHEPQDHEHVPASSRDGVTPFRRPKPGKGPPDTPTALN